jgi:hypothetical protein
MMSRLKPTRGDRDAPAPEYLKALYTKITLRLRQAESDLLQELSRVTDKSAKAVLLEAMLLLARRRGVPVPEGFGLDGRSRGNVVDGSSPFGGTYSVYVLLDDSGAPRYVGRTRHLDIRIGAHIGGRSSRQVSEWVRTEAEQGRTIAARTLIAGAGYSEAKRLEQDFIRKLRRRFPLLNKRGKVH